jgi:hypothetical protein
VLVPKLFYQDEATKEERLERMINPLWGSQPKKREMGTKGYLQKPDVNGLQEIRRNLFLSPLIVDKQGSFYHNLSVIAITKEV